MLNTIIIGDPLYLNTKTKELIKLIGFSQGSVFGYTEDSKSVEFSEQEAMETLETTTLKDWPGLATSDPKLPYVFDLYWDIKRPSQMFNSCFEDECEEAIEYAKEFYMNNIDFKALIDKAESGPLLKLAKIIKDSVQRITLEVAEVID